MLSSPFTKIIALFFVTGVLCIGQSLDLLRVASICRSGNAGAQPRIQTVSGAPILECTARFANETSQRRAIWDIPIKLDLSQVAGIKLRVFCRHPQLASQFVLHIKANGNWYTAPFEMTQKEQWEEIIIPKSHFYTESKNGSWKNSDTLRLAIWRGSPGNITLYLSAITFLTPNCPIALIRGTTTPKAITQKASHKYAQNIQNALTLHGIYPAVIDESDLAYSTLRPYKLSIIPLTETLSSQQIRNILAYLKGGGKCALFHSLPPLLASQMNLPVGHFMQASSISGAISGIIPNKSRLGSLPSVSQLSTSFIAVENLPQNAFVSAWWMNAASRSTRYPAFIENANGCWMTHIYLNQDPVNGGMLLKAQFARYVPNLQAISATTLIQNTQMQLLASSQSANLSLNKARQCYQNHAYQQAAWECLAVQEKLKHSTKPTLRQRPNEIRAIWCRYPNGLPGHDWNQTVALLSTSGMNALFPFALSPFLSSYPSRLVHQNPGSGLQGCLQAASTQGIRVHAWVNCLGVEDAPEAVLNGWAREGRLQIGPNGNRINWLCPNHPENVTLLKRLVTELVAQNKLEGVHLDRLRYPGKESCYCENCRQAFARFIGFTPPHWPTFVRGGEYQKQWESFRIYAISRLLIELSTAIETARPHTWISVAVFPDCQQAKLTVAQDWAAWCRNKQVSFVCPMTYRDSTVLFSADLTRQIQAVQMPERIVPGIGASTNRLSLDEIIRQINETRAHKNYGFSLFDLGQREAITLLPALKSRQIIE